MRQPVYRLFCIVYKICFNNIAAVFRPLAGRVIFVAFVTATATTVIGPVAGIAGDATSPLVRPPSVQDCVAFRNDISAGKKDKRDVKLQNWFVYSSPHLYLHQKALKGLFGTRLPTNFLSLYARISFPGVLGFSSFMIFNSYIFQDDLICWS